MPVRKTLYSFGEASERFSIEPRALQWAVDEDRIVSLHDGPFYYFEAEDLRLLRDYLKVQQAWEECDFDPLDREIYEREVGIWDPEMDRC